jgi:hypothetical protein
MKAAQRQPKPVVGTPAVSRCRRQAAREMLERPTRGSSHVGSARHLAGVGLLTHPSPAFAGTPSRCLGGVCLIVSVVDVFIDFLLANSAIDLAGHLIVAYPLNDFLQLAKALRRTLR